MRWPSLAWFDSRRRDRERNPNRPRDEVSESEVRGDPLNVHISTLERQTPLNLQRGFAAENRRIAIPDWFAVLTPKRVFAIRFYAIFLLQVWLFGRSWDSATIAEWKLESKRSLVILVI